MSYTIGTSEQFVERQLQATAWQAPAVFQGIHIAHCSLSERAERILACVELLAVETALELREVEYRQLQHLRVSVVVDAIGPHRPMAAHLLPSFVEVGFEVCGTLFREDLVQAFADQLFLSVP